MSFILIWVRLAPILGVFIRGFSMNYPEDTVLGFHFQSFGVNQGTFDVPAHETRSAHVVVELGQLRFITGF